MSRNSTEFGEGREEEPEPISIRVGGGNPVEVLKITEGTEQTVDGTSEIVEKELSREEAGKLTEVLADLPFHIGHSKGTRAFGPEGEMQDSDRQKHPAEVSIIPYVSGAPKGKEEYAVVFKFTEPNEAWDAGFHPHSVKNLEIHQPMRSSAQNWPEGEREKINTRIGFSPEKPIKIGNKKVTMISLVVER